MISEEALDRALCTDENYDIVKRRTEAFGAPVVLYYIEGLTDADAVSRLISSAAEPLPGPAKLSDRIASCAGAGVCRGTDEAVSALLSGKTLFLYGDACVSADFRKYPQRGITEPENDKVLRGPRTGFGETLTVNTALIRRHIRDPRLMMKHRSVGSVSKTDVVICYMNGEADPDYVARLDSLISTLDVGSLTLGAESLAERLIKRRWFDPFPKIRYTERPDCAAAHLLEGRVIVLVDNSPNAMILPSAIFDFIQESDDYYLPPLVGTYFRTVRCTVFFLTLFLSPLWYLLISYPQWIPEWLSFIKVHDHAGMPIIAQLFVLEFAVDGLKLAALNTPSMLSGSFSIIGGLILGDFAVRVGWFVPDTILYMAFVAIANFSQPSYELGYAFKFLRLLLLALTALFGVWGFVSGFVVFIVLIAANRTVGGKSYLYPLIPFDGRALLRHVIRPRGRR